MHAAEIAAELGIERILCPCTGGVLSALGLCASDRRRDTVRTVMLSGGELTAERIAEEVGALTAGLEGEPDSQPEVVYEMRYAGQAFELPVPGPPDPDPADLAERFAVAHEDLYGQRDPDGEVVLVHIRLALVSAGARPRPTAAGEAQLEESVRDVHFGGESRSTRVLRGEPAAGILVAGPVVFELPETTLVLPPGWSAEVDGAGTIRAEIDS